MAEEITEVLNYPKKNCRIIVNVDEVLTDILVVSYRADSKLYQGVLLDSSKKLLPCGIVAPSYLLPPLGTAVAPAVEEGEDKLYSASQRFSYFQDKLPPAAGRLQLKRNIRPPARFRNARMTVRLRPRQVLCSKCRGICNENSENVDLSSSSKTKRKNADTGNGENSPPVKITRGDRRLRSSGDVSPVPLFPDNKKSCNNDSKPNLGSSLIPKLSRLQPNEISNAMNGKVKIKIVGNYWVKSDEENDVTVMNMSDVDNDKINNVCDPLAIDTVDLVDVDVSSDNKTICEQDPLAILDGDHEEVRDEDEDEDSNQSLSKRTLRKKRSVGSMEDLWTETMFEDNADVTKSRTTPVIRISFGSGTGEGTVMKIPSKVQNYIPVGPKSADDEEKSKRDASAKAAKKALKKAKKEARRKILGSNSPVCSSPRYAISCSSPRYHFGSGSPRYSLGNSSPAYEIFQTRRHKHKVKHKKKHKGDKKPKDVENVANIPVNSDSSIREQCLKQKLSISLKRLNANAYTARYDSSTTSSSGSKSPSNSEGSADDHCDTVPDFPGNSLMMRLPSQSINTCQTSDGRCMTVGDVVWGKIHGFPWWPGKVLSIVVSRKDDGVCVSPQAHVAWYGSSTSSLMSCDQLNPFLETFQMRYNKKKRGPYKEAIKQATSEAKRGEEITLSPVYSSPSEVNVVS